MEPQVISYLEMCSREGVNLQQGMNFRLGGHYSVILMSVRPNAPYRDALLDDGTTLIYEGHDVPRTSPSIDPKAVDQPERTSAGTLTQNRKFHHIGEQRVFQEHPQPRRLIPTQVKLKVWKRDGGKCVQCGATDELHFDHIIPYSRGGTSLSADNIQLLCARHNLAKRDKIE